MIGFLRQIGRGIDAGKFFEIVDKMCLIEIAAACRHIDPGKMLPGAMFCSREKKARWGWPFAHRVVPKCHKPSLNIFIISASSTSTFRP
jgi:hypothetical protein